MYGQYPLYTFVLTASATAMVGLALYVWQRRPAVGATSFSLLLAAVAEWSLSNAFEMASVSLEAKIFWGNMQFLGIVIVPASLLVFTLQYTARERWLPRFYPVLLAIEPIATVILVWTNESHHLMRERVWIEQLGPATVLVVEFGTFFWTHASYSYLLLLVAAVLFLPYIFRSSELYRGQALTVLVGALMPWMANFLYLSGLSPLPYLDLTPPAFILMGASLTWGLFRFRLMDVVPGARSAIVDGLADGVLVVGPHGRVLDANPAATQIFASQGNDLIGKTLEEASAAQPTLRPFLLESTLPEPELALEIGGQRRVYELHRNELFREDNMPTGHVVVLRDITERKRTEQELIQASRLGAVGELSLGISHNLNNILTGITGPASMLARADLDGSSKEHLQAILASAERATDLVRRLGETTRNRASELAGVNVNDIVTEAVRGARPRWQDEAQAAGRNIQVITELGETPLVTANHAELYDALLNLLINAVDALPEGGRIDMRTRLEAGAVVVEVSDSGVGMDEPTRQRLFEPFFTTKTGVGTGLGLSTTYMAVRHWGGEIHVDSEPGAGTTFTLRLPVWSGPVPEQAAEPAPTPGDAAVEAARVLIAEDEGIIGMMLVEQLRADGHQAECVSDGTQARKAFAAGRYHLAILDLGMPGVPGDQLAREFRAQDPHLVTILATGWTLDAGDARRLAADLYLQKPFTIDRVRAVAGAALALYRERAQASR